GGGAPTGGTPPDGRAGTAGKAPGDTRTARTAQDCRDFRDGRIDPTRRQQLEAAAKNSGGVRQFCDQVLADDRRSGGSSTGTDVGAVAEVPDTDAGTGTGGAGGTGTDGTGDRIAGGGDADPDPGDERDGGGGGTGKEKPSGPKAPVKGGGKAP
ncbi:hypothetical protein M4914_14335, partial [Streptomyces somaliensis DSM 40738]|nr:hypothetical protein [Streptomyces somaliensis DSM 40738]